MLEGRFQHRKASNRTGQEGVLFDVATSSLFAGNADPSRIDLPGTMRGAPRGEAIVQSVNCLRSSNKTSTSLEKRRLPEVLGEFRMASGTD